MSELRKDPLVDRWVIVAPERARRPALLDGTHAATTSRETCPFCPGNEAKTPPEVTAHRPPAGPAAARDAPGWSLRVVPQKFPALRVEDALDPHADGVYDAAGGLGAHEVVVETPEHARDLGSLAPTAIEGVLAAWQARIADLKRDVRLRSVLVYKNHGIAVGETLGHSHSQIVGLPTVPKALADELHGAAVYHGFKGRCPFCDIVRHERAGRTRVVDENDDVLVLAPYASRVPFETWIVARRHRPAFERSTSSELAAAADALGRTLRRLAFALDDAPWSMVLHSAPAGDEECPFFHWHVEVLPRTMSAYGGFEWASGFAINPTPPEEAARFLRDMSES